MTTPPEKTPEELRTELLETLHAIEYKLNIPKRTVGRVRSLARSHPFLTTASILTAVATISGVCALVLTQKFRR